MRHSLLIVSLVLASVAGSVALVAARQQATPGMSPARFWINNRTRDEAIPVSIANVDPKAPNVPVQINGVAFVDFTDRARATLNELQSRTQPVVLAHQQWEYREMRFTVDDDRVTQLNQAGTQGWEVTGTSALGDRLIVLLKRPR
jgi:hypothetical protein